MCDLERKGLFKLDALKKIELDIQKHWNSEKVFEVNSSDASLYNGKYFATFPYPYMNGRLHIGHSFSLSKCEFSISFERLKGKHCLFPFGLHCTGMPIKACADKLKFEIETYGFPPCFESAPETVDSAGNKVKSVFQWHIMKSFGLEDEEVKKFIDTDYWLEYFPRNAVNDLKRLGVKVDWRRSFITTDVNPFYDSFVRWQFNKLKKFNYVRFGKRYTIYSPKDNQPCMDHDRLSGEGVAPYEYLVIKFELVDTGCEAIKDIMSKKGKIFLCTATLRAETIFGVTNCFLHPDINYILFQSNVENEYYLTTNRASRNMSFQDLTPVFGEYKVVLNVKGSELFGSKLYAPQTVHEYIYVLPMMAIKADKGTGVVMSVPSDSADDYAALMDLKNKQALRKKYGITEEMIIEPVPLIEVPGYGTTSAKAVYEELKISGQNDSEKLQKAKEIIYKLGFYEGKMVTDNQFLGLSTKEAKPRIQKMLLDLKEAFIYQEPESKIVSRSGDECVVALCDQWYLAYGQDKWKEKTMECLRKLNTYCSETMNGFLSTMDWLHEHACARSYGLGTKLPWDPVYLIESLSDSTIYMAYYTVAHLIQGSRLDAKEGNALKILGSQMNDDAWEYIFNPSAEYVPCMVPKEKLDILKKEFMYWYPVDVRVSGKDLVPNHLTYYLYNHVAMWWDNPEFWPKSIRANGHLLLNTEKMSKSTGNFLTLADSVDRYGADAVRFALADAGDTIEDANFVEKIADNAILRIFNFMEWVNSLDFNLIENKEYSTLDKLFKNEIDYAIVRTYENYEIMLYKEALKSGFYELQNAKDFYLDFCKQTKFTENIELLKYFVDIQLIILSPICPHVCDHLYRQLNKGKSIIHCRWPDVTVFDKLLRQKLLFINNSCHNFRTKTNLKASKEATIYFAEKYNDWQILILEFVRKYYYEDPGNKEFPSNKVLVDFLKACPENNGANGKKMNKFMSFYHYLKTQEALDGPDVLDLTLPFGEAEILNEISEYVAASLALEKLSIKSSDGCSVILEQCTPGKPTIMFEK